jgi:hypothetical protein
MEIRPVEVEMFHADGQTDTTKLTGAFFIILGTRLRIHAGINHQLIYRRKIIGLYNNSFSSFILLRKVRSFA